MSMSKAEQRQIENEMIFRRMNEKVGSDLDAVDAAYIANDNFHLVRNANVKLFFKCECSDEDCDTRIPLKLSTYKELHTDRDTFIVITNHQVDEIEKIVLETKKYSVVKKNKSTPEPNDTLKHTSTDNS